MKNGEDVAMFHTFIEREWIFEFLVGLNVEHDQVLGKDSLASLNEVFLIIRAKERRSVMLNIITSKGSGLSILSSQNSQFIAQILVGESYSDNQVTRIAYGAIIARNQGIRRRCVGSYMGNQSPLVGMVEIGTNNSSDNEETKHMWHFCRQNLAMRNSNSSEFEGLKKKEIERLWNFPTSLDESNTSCSLVRSRKYSITCSFNASKKIWHGN